MSQPDPNCEWCHGKGVGGGCGADDCAEQGHMHTYWFCSCTLRPVLPAHNNQEPT